MTLREQFESEWEGEAERPLKILKKFSPLEYEKMYSTWLEARAGQHETIVIGWIEFKGNEKLFNKEARKNCKIMFDDGSICRYNDEHPRAIMTHFKIAESQ